MNFLCVKMLYKCFSEYGYYKYFPIFHDFNTKFLLLNPKIAKFVSKHLVCLADIILVRQWTIYVQHFYTTALKDMNTTHIFKFLAIFTQIFNI